MSDMKLRHQKHSPALDSSGLVSARVLQIWRKLFFSPSEALEIALKKKINLCLIQSCFTPVYTAYCWMKRYRCHSWYQHLKLTKIYLLYIYKMSSTPLIYWKIDNFAALPKVAMKPLPLVVRYCYCEGVCLIYWDISKQTTDRYYLIQPWCLPAVRCGAIWYNSVRRYATLWTFCLLIANNVTACERKFKLACVY